MSNTQPHEEHESIIKTPKQLITTIVLSLVVPVIVIILLVKLVTTGDQVGAGSDILGPEATQKRIAPIAKLELVDASGPKIFKTGVQVYKAACAGCHDAGAAGAPKFADAAAWAGPNATGLQSMVANAIKGKGAMPAKGGNPSLDDFEIERAVVYMANSAGGKFAEPTEPKSAPAVAAAPAMAAPAAAPMVAAAPAVSAPVASAPAAAPTAPAPATNDVGEKLYKQACAACHIAGVAGAPKFADKTAWAPRIATGMDAMVASVIKGKGIMPAKGGAANASDADLRAAAQYMVDAAK
ncbi:MAG: c-type cytochrome [Burkholderiaceae bacterium]|nr:c-type cytochrome [Burkholderiaceae bacterium]MDP4968908.1 c-type cytochrome [Burkholderiaceae bacterium]MDP5110951.1 c-type cytochrome [Burkholderiaceae bacterium]